MDGVRTPAGRTFPFRKRIKQHKQIALKDQFKIKATHLGGGKGVRLRSKLGSAQSKSWLRKPF